MEEDIKLLLSYIETEVREGKKQLIGNGVVVNGAAILKLIDRIRVALPMATGEDKIIEATEKAKEIINLAEDRKAGLIDNDIATKEARVKAERIIQQALIQKSKMEHDLAQNLSDMLTAVKDVMEEADRKIAVTNAEVIKKVDSALSRISVKLQ